MRSINNYLELLLPRERDLERLLALLVRSFSFSCSVDFSSFSSNSLSFSFSLSISLSLLGDADFDLDFLFSGVRLRDFVLERRLESNVRNLINSVQYT